MYRGRQKTVESFTGQLHEFALCVLISVNKNRYAQDFASSEQRTVSVRGTKKKKEFAQNWSQGVQGVLMKSLLLKGDRSPVMYQ